VELDVEVDVIVVGKQATSPVVVVGRRDVVVVVVETSPNDVIGDVTDAPAPSGVPLSPIGVALRAGSWVAEVEVAAAAAGGSERRRQAATRVRGCVEVAAAAAAAGRGDRGTAEERGRRLYWDLEDHEPIGGGGGGGVASSQRRQTFSRHALPSYNVVQEPRCQETKLAAKCISVHFGHKFVSF